MKQLKKIITVFIFILAAFGGCLTVPEITFAAPSAAASANLRDELFNLEEPDERTIKLEAFLLSYDSPLAKHAADFVISADRYGLDWKLVPAITGIESTFGKRIPYGSYNAYGWANGTYYFESWEQSIDHVSRILKEKYYDRGLTTPQTIAPVYAPPSNTWAGKVSYFMKKIDDFEPETSIENLELSF